ncbi:MAG: hypothetical protein JXA42_17710 [Anaerolineales bacterium]|nr:hypothetical protein [Anaerolineales bacterium]
MPNISVKNYKGVEVERIKNAPSAKDAEMRLMDAIIEKILEANDIEAPQDLVDYETRMMAVELYKNRQYERMLSGEDLGFMPDDMADHMEALSKKAFKQVKTRLILEGIIEAENLQITQEELEAEAKAIAVRQQTPVEAVKDFLGEDLALLKDDLLVRKAIDLIYINAVIK